MVFLLSDPTEKGRLLTFTWNLSPVSRFSTVTFMNVLDVMVRWLGLRTATADQVNARGLDP